MAAKGVWFAQGQQGRVEQLSQDTAEIRNNNKTTPNSQVWGKALLATCGRAVERSRSQDRHRAALWKKGSQENSSQPRATFARRCRESEDRNLPRRNLMVGRTVSGSEQPGHSLLGGGVPESRHGKWQMANGWSGKLDSVAVHSATPRPPRMRQINLPIRQTKRHNLSTTGTFDPSYCHYQTFTREEL